MKTVIVFGLSANPPTGLEGHAGIVRWAAGQADEVWVLPVYRHAFHEKRDLAPWEDRVAMARLAFERLPGLEGRVHVLETERELVEAAGPDAMVGTIDVMRRLSRDHPGVGLQLLLGADTYRDLLRGKWKESDALRAMVPVRVVAREGIAADPTLEHTLERVPGLGDVSSSSVRASTDPALLSRVLQPEVREYIERHALYAFAHE